jgi:HJR/Mrr/RecB family endonuclease
MGMKSWRTQSSNDDGVDAVVYREGPFFAGVCVIQAKRYSKTVPVEDVRAIYGTMHQKNAPDTDHCAVICRRPELAKKLPELSFGLRERDRLITLRVMPTERIEQE